MTPDQLLTFAVVAEHANISRAAQALFLSQPAVSGQLRLLQDAVGEPLYRREGRGIVLTETGQQLAIYAQALRASYEQAQALRDTLRGLSGGTLRIGASTTPASYLLPHLIADFHRQHPGVALSTMDGNTREIIAALAGLDVAMIEGPVPAGLGPGVGVHRWHDDEIVAVVRSSHPLAGGAERATLPNATLAQLAGYPLIWREPGSGVRQSVEQAFAAAGIAARPALELAGVESVKEAVRAGMGIGFVSAMSMRHEGPLLGSLRIGAAGLSRHFTILVPHEAAPSRAARAFLELCLAGAFK